MKFPENLKYSKEHEWVRVEGDQAYVGITDFAQKELGEIVYVDVTSEGDDLAQGDIFGSIEAVKTVSDLFLPIDAKVVELNPALEDSPELINNDPYGEGWIIKVEIKDKSQIETLLSANEYKEMIGA